MSCEGAVHRARRRALWGGYGGLYFLRASKAKAKPLLLEEKPATT